MTQATERPATGLECYLYYSTGTYATPVLVQITRAINVSYSISMTEADQRSRSSTWAKGRMTHKELEITFTYRKKMGTDTVFDELQAAALAGTVYEYFILDGIKTTSGIQGIRAFCQISSFSNTQDLASSEEVEFSLKPTYFEESNVEIDPIWYEVS